jgi:hypothetical protein
MSIFTNLFDYEITQALDYVTDHAVVIPPGRGPMFVSGCYSLVRLTINDRKRGYNEESSSRLPSS